MTDELPPAARAALLHDLRKITPQDELKMLLEEGDHQKSANRRGSEWSDAEEALLRDLQARDAEMSEYKAALGRTAGAIDGRLQKLGLRRTSRRRK